MPQIEVLLYCEDDGYSAAWFDWLTSLQAEARKPLALARAGTPARTRTRAAPSPCRKPGGTASTS